jgi:broad specificity phosphatase PhoE
VSASLLFARHGRTEANARGVLLGREDPPLDETGEAQAAALARALCGGRFGQPVAVVSSPLRRTVRTAEHIAAAAGLAVQVDDRLIELDYGEFEGLPVDGLPQETWLEWHADVHFRPPGGETLAELGARVRECCTEWTEVASHAGSSAGGATSGGNVVLVSHVSPIKAAVSWALDVGEDLAWRAHLDPASITRVLLRSGRPALGLFNETAHLS